MWKEGKREGRGLCSHGVSRWCDTGITNRVGQGKDPFGRREERGDGGSPFDGEE